MHVTNKKIQKYFESHPKTLPKYLHITLSTVTTVQRVCIKFRNIFASFLLGPRWEVRKQHENRPLYLYIRLGKGMLLDQITDGKIK
jgi:hypothetical protein